MFDCYIRTSKEVVIDNIRFQRVFEPKLIRPQFENVKSDGIVELNCEIG